MHGADIQQVKLGGGAGGGEVEVTEQLARAAEKQHRASSMLRGQGPEPQQPRAPKAVSETGSRRHVRRLQHFNTCGLIFHIVTLFLMVLALHLQYR